MKNRIFNLLRWSEKYTKTDMVYLSSGGFWLALGHITNIISGLIVVVAFANLVSKEIYGTYQFVMSVSAILGSFSLSKIGTVITKAVAQGEEGSLRQGFKIKLKWSIGIVIVSGTLAFYYYLNENNILATSFLIVGSLLPLLENFRLYNSFLIGKQLFRESSMLGFWRKPIPVISILLAVFLTDNVVTLIFIYFVSHTVSVGLLYLLVIKKYNPPYQTKYDLKSLSKHLSLISIIGMISSHLDKLLIFHLLGAVPVAIYTLAQVPIKQMENAFGLIKQMTLPKLSKSNYTDIRKNLPRKVKISFIFTSLIVITYILVAPFLFRIFFPDYQEAILYTQILSLIILSAPRGFYIQAFIAHEKKLNVYISRLSLYLSGIFFLLIFLPFFGIWGAIIAILSSHLFANIVIRILFNKSNA